MFKVGQTGVDFTCYGIFLPDLYSHEHSNPVDLRLATAIKGDGLAWGTLESPEEG